MNAKERFRLRAKSAEFMLPPKIIRGLAGVLGVSDPFRPAEHELRAIFIHVPKAAGTSIARALFDEKSKHLALNRYWAFNAAATKAYFKFAFVRNPWDRFQSAFHYLAKETLIKSPQTLFAIDWT